VTITGADLRFMETPLCQAIAQLLPVWRNNRAINARALADGHIGNIEGHKARPLHQFAEFLDFPHNISRLWRDGAAIARLKPSFRRK